MLPARGALAAPTALLRNVLSGVLPSTAGRQGPAQLAWLHAGCPALVPDVTVPPLGESVSEGTISALLKNVGDKVAVDEPCAQLETDKVTIDCKSPHAGVITAVLVKLGDTVKPGAVLCSVGDTLAGSGGAASGSAPSPPQPPPASTPSGKPAAAAAGSGHRHPMIHFPPRRLPDGRRISDLPAAEADAALAALAGGAPAAPSSPLPAPATPAPARPTEGSSPAALGFKAAAPRPAAIKPAPARRTLTQREIDAINSGGVV